MIKHSLFQFQRGKKCWFVPTKEMKKNEFSNKKVNFFSVLQIFDDFLKKDWVKSRKMKRAFSADLKYAYYIFLKNKRHTANLQNSALKILRHFLLKKLSYFWLTNKTQGSVSVFFYSVSKKSPAIHSTQSNVPKKIKWRVLEMFHRKSYDSTSLYSVKPATIILCW